MGRKKIVKVGRADMFGPKLAEIERMQAEQRLKLLNLRVMYELDCINAGKKPVPYGAVELDKKIETEKSDARMMLANTAYFKEHRANPNGRKLLKLATERTL